MRNSGASLTVIWADNVPTTRSRRLRWSTRLICGWPIKPVQAGRTAPTSSLSPPKRCAKSWLTTPGASEPRNGAGGALKVELDEAAIVSPEQSQSRPAAQSCASARGERFHQRLKNDQVFGDD